MTVKSLLVRIGADTKELEQKLGKANTYVQKHADQFKKAGKVATVAGAAIVGALGMMVRSYVKTGDEVHKMALRTGFSTKALSELGYAADISGTDLGSLEKGVKKMAKTISDADDGLVTYQRAFNKIGVSYKALMDLSPEEQFDVLAKAIADVESPTIRAAVAQDIFGRAGTQLLPLFAAGSEGIEELRQKARDMGIVFDQEAAEKAAVLNDSITTLKGSFKGATKTIAGILVPIITSLTDKISDIIIKFKDWAEKHPELSNLVVKLTAGIGILLTVLGPILIFLPAIAAGMAAISAPVLIAVGAIAALTAAGYLLIKNWDAIRNFFKTVWAKLSALFDTTIGKILAVVFPFIGLPLLISKHWEGITEFFKSIGSIIVGSFKWVADKASKIFSWIAGAITDALLWLADKIAKIPLVKKFVKGFKEGLEEAKAAMAEVVPPITGSVGEIIEKNEELKTNFTEIPPVVKEASTKIASLIQTMTGEIKQATLDEYEYAKWALEQKLADRIAEIEAEEASEAEKNEAIAMAREVFRLEDEALDKEHTTKKVEREKDLITKWKAMWKNYWTAVKAKQKEYLSASKDVTDRLNQLTMDEFTYRQEVLDKKFEAEKEYWKKLIRETGKGKEELSILEAIYDAKTTEIRDDALEAELKRIEEEERARENALDRTVEKINSVLNMIGGFFQGIFNLKMTLIDREEDRINEAINSEYDKKKQYILDNIKDEEAQKEALIKLEEEKNEALRLASEELEEKRKKARRTAAKQEKAVALLSAIVNTAAAVVKALPNIPLAIAVGILGAVQIAIIAATPLPPLKEGGIVMKRTEAVIGEVPEAIIPLTKLGRIGGLVPAPVGISMNVYFYGDVNNAGDMDMISDRLANKVRRAVERGR